MKKLIFILSLIILSCATSKVQHKEFNDQAYKSQEPGKCYYPFRNSSQEEWIPRKPMLIEIVDPIYSKTIKVFKVSELLKKNPNKKVVSYKVRQAHVKYEINDELKEGLSYERDTGYLYCLMELPSIYKSISLDTIKTDHFEVEFIEINNPARIKYTEIGKRPKTLMTNQLYFESGRWSNEKELDFGIYCPADLFLDLQKALNERGYKLKETNRFDAATRTALIDFQKQNNLQLGSLNFETLQLLDIQ